MGAGQISSAPSPGGEGRDEGGQLFAPKAPHQILRRFLSCALIQFGNQFMMEFVKKYYYSLVILLPEHSHVCAS
jgi:hypothetical protein